jgi:hypothetical protein
MLVHSNLETGIRILRQEANKIVGNMSYSKATSIEVFKGFCLIDDSPKSFKGKLITDFGVDIGKVFIVYLDDQNIISRLNLPRFEVEWNYDNLHKNRQFDINSQIFSCKVMDISTPHGLLLSHTELLVVSNS